MTQAYNLSQLANNLNSTGQLDATDGLVNAVPVTNGGTGASTAAAARTNLELGTIATQAANSVSITGGSITGITDLAVADGGTGASTASTARANLVVPSTTGENASGTWNINISGNAATATTATNVSNPGVGVGQSWVNYISNSVGTARQSNVEYTNDTGKPIMVFATPTIGGNTGIWVGGVQLAYTAGGNQQNWISFIVPAGNTYKIQANSGIAYWSELR